MEESISQLEANHYKPTGIFNCHEIEDIQNSILTNLYVQQG